jgi:hypothetical protein
MATIGLFGDEYDECVGLLKARIEDAGRRARIINLRRFPGVTRATIDSTRVVCDGYDLLQMDAFYLREVSARDAFFHVRYTRSLWESLRERYIDFSAREEDAAAFARAIVEIVASQKPMVNEPRVYTCRRHLPYELDLLSRRGVRVAPFSAAAVEMEAGGSSGKPRAEPGAEAALLDLDEELAYDVYSFPKGDVAPTRIERANVELGSLVLVVVGGRVLDRAVSLDAARRCSIVDLGALPVGLEQTALDAAGALGAAFAEVEVGRAAGRGETMVLKVDPAPYFARWEEVGLEVARPLAEYLIGLAS